MSSTELDMPLTPSADQIRRREFVTVRRGYDPDQVRAYLRQVGDQIESLEEHLQSTRAEIASVMQAHAQAEAEAATVAQRSRDDAYSQLSERMVDLLRTAERHAEDMRREAEEEANRMIAEARAEADRIKLDSQAKAEMVRQEAEDLMRGSKNKADRMVVGLSSRREALAMELEEMRGRMLSMVSSIDAIEQDALEEQVAIVPEEALEQREIPELELPVSPAPEPPTTEQFLTDPQFAGLWGDDAVSEPTLDDVEPEDPPF